MYTLNYQKRLRIYPNTVCLRTFGSLRFVLFMKNNDDVRVVWSYCATIYIVRCALRVRRFTARWAWQNRPQPMRWRWRG